MPKALRELGNGIESFQAMDIGSGWVERQPYRTKFPFSSKDTKSRKARSYVEKSTTPVTTIP